MVKIYKQPFAHDGDAIAIPDASQPDGKMSSADGWTPDYQLPKTDPNYKPVGRQEMNGVFKEVTEAIGQVQVQGTASWSPDGTPYPVRAQVYHNGKQWLALRANSVKPVEGADWTELVGKQYIDAADYLQPSMTGSATLNGTIENTLALTNIVTTLGLEVGDVIRIQYSGYDKLHTVEYIGAANTTIVVNFEHAGNRGNGSLRLANTTATATITRIAKWFNAPTGLGQAWVGVKSSRALATTYTNTTGRPIQALVTAFSDGSASGLSMNVAIQDVYVIAHGGGMSVVGVYKGASMSFIIPDGGTYRLELSQGRNDYWVELR